MINEHDINDMFDESKQPKPKPEPEPEKLKIEVEVEVDSEEVIAAILATIPFGR